MSHDSTKNFQTVSKHQGLRIMADRYKCFYEKKADGFIQLICFLVGDFENELDLPLEVWPSSCVYGGNFVDLIDAKGVVHLDGDEVDYGFKKDHCHKCLVFGCHDPCMYQPIPHKMLLNSKRVRDCKRVLVEFNGIVSDMGISFSLFSKVRKVVGVAFTGPEWERVCESEMFSASKVIVISSDEYCSSFVGKVIDGFVCDTDFMTKIISGPCESSNSAIVSKKSFIIEFSHCVSQRDTCLHYCDLFFLSEYPGLFSLSPYSWGLSRGVHLVGEMYHLKEVLELIVGDRILFELVSGNISSDEPIFFNVIKLD
ncbi:hypothetical protein Tco_1246054 [Tanacetum coccineum]